LEVPLGLRMCPELNSDRFPALRRIEMCNIGVASSLDLSGISTKGGLDFLVDGPLEDIKLPTEPLRSLFLQSSHIKAMTAGGALHFAILSVEDLSLSYFTAEDLGTCLWKITGIRPVEGQPFTFPHLRRLELRGSHSCLDMSLLNLPALQHLKLRGPDAILRSENFPSLETLECYECKIALMGDFSELRSLDMQLGLFDAESKFTAPLLQEMSFSSVDGVKILNVGRLTFPSLQVVSITMSAKYYGPVEEKFIPRLIGDAELDRSPPIVLRMDMALTLVAGVRLQAEVPYWIAFSSVCNLPGKDRP